MRVLFVSNYYPPGDRGGYEQWCAEVAGALARRGHRLRVLTSSAGAVRDGAAAEPRLVVERVLNLEVEAGIASTVMRAGPLRRRLEHHNLEHVRRVVAQFEPEAAMVWGMWNVPRSVPALLEALLPGRVAYYLCDYWPALPDAWIQQLQVPPRHAWAAWPKRLLGWPVLADLSRRPPIPLRFEHAYCVSRALRQALVDAGLPLAHAGVIYGGTQIGEPPPRTLDGRSDRLRLLYAGRLTPDKGVHTGLQALALLSAEERRGVSLDIVGRGEADYQARLRGMVEDYGLTDCVTFRAGVTRAEMPRLLAGYEVLLALSVWAEPFARIVLEAMAAGLVVIGTTTGGTPELLRPGATGLAVPPDDPGAVAAQVRRLAQEPALRARLARAGRQAVEVGFTFERMLDRLEDRLQAMRAAAHGQVSTCVQLGPDRRPRCAWQY